MKIVNIVDIGHLNVKYEALCMWYFVWLTAYEIEVTTTDKKDAGMIHNGWLVLEGDQRSSKEFILENSTKTKVLRR